MPELPEVETIRRGLEPVLVGRRIARLEQRRPDLRFPLPERFAERLQGRRVKRLGRRAKYLLVHLDSGEVLAIHLGMSGRVRVTAAAASKATQLGDFTYEHGDDPAHDHVVFTLDGGTVVTYNDARRFGFMVLLAEDELVTHALFRGLGIEPLGNELTADYLARRAKGRKADLKAFLMDQRIVAGLGNIYVCEALFQAGLKPSRPAAVLGAVSTAAQARAERLAHAIRHVLDAALQAGGSSLRDYKQADGSLGNFQKSFAVYGRAGEPCIRPGCRGIVRRKTQGGRSTFACSACQR